MQAANGSNKTQAGQKRTSSRRDKSLSSGGPVTGPQGKEGEYDSSESESSSDSSSTTSSAGTTTSSSSTSSISSNNIGGREGQRTRNRSAIDLDNVFEDDDFGQYFPVSCADNEGKFYLKRFARGSVGKCVLFKGRWHTPNEFQAVSGRKSSKDWKRSIRLRGRILKEFISQGLFQEHAKTCVCKICCGEDVDMLKQEGEMALAAKRRRLSQADSNPPPLLEPRPIQSPIAMVTGSLTTPVNNVEALSPFQEGGGEGGSTKKGRSRKSLVKLEPMESKEEEVVRDTPTVLDSVSSNDEEEEYKPNDVFVSAEQAPPNSIVDSSDFIPRRSRRTTHRKHVGHRTELGTFTNKPSQWDAEEVSEFLQLQGYGSYSDSFVNNEIDGQSMFLLKETHLMDRFQMKLGPALTLIDIISRLRHPPIC